MITQAFFYELVANAGVAAITTALYPHHIPQGIRYPALTYSVDADDHEPTLDGISSLKTALFSVDCWDHSYRTAHELADAVEAALINLSGDMGGLSPSQSVDVIRKERRLDLFETDTKLYRVSLQFSVAYW